MLRIRQRVGLNLSNAATTSAGWAPLYWMLPRFARVFITIRGPQAHWDSVESNPPFPFPPKGKPGRGKVPPTPRHVPRQLTTLARPMLRLPPARGAFAPLAPSPDQSQPMFPSEDDCAWEKIKGGRHVGLDFYDLLIEVTMLHGVTPPGCPRKTGTLRNPTDVRK